jgi:Ankyrin repeats (3 copies)
MTLDSFHNVVSNNYNKYGDYLLHAAVRDNTGDTFYHIIKMYPMAVRYKNRLGEYPLHVACLSYFNKEIVLKLIELFPQAVKERIIMIVIHYIVLAGNRKWLLWNWLKSSHKRRFNLLGWFINIVITDYHSMPIQHVNPQWSSKDWSVLIHRLYKKEILIVVILSIAWCPITLFEGMIETLRLIIDSDPLALQRQTSCGKSPLNIPSESHWGVDMVECILSSSTATKSISNQRDMCGMTPLHYACYHRGDEIVEKLLQHPSIDVNATDDLDDTPLHKLFYQDK